MIISQNKGLIGMFQCGDMVLYGIHGVCKIIGVERMKLGKTPAEYYALEPVDQPQSRYYIPTHNESAVAKLRPIITQAEFNEMVQSADIQDDLWIEDENQRKQCYSSLIASSDRAGLIRMVHTLYKHRAQLAEAGRKLHLCDETFLRNAEKLLDTEISLVMNIDHSEVKDYMQAVLSQEKDAK